MSIILWPPLTPCPSMASAPLVASAAQAIDPIVDAIPPQTGNVGSAVSVSVVARDRLTYSATGLPPGTSIDPLTGLIQGTPTTAGTYNVTVRVTNQSQKFSEVSLVWTVSAALPVLINTSQLTSVGTVNIQTSVPILTPQPTQRTISRISFFARQSGSANDITLAIRDLITNVVSVNTNGPQVLTGTVARVDWDYNPPVVLPANNQAALLMNQAALFDISTQDSPLVEIQNNVNITPRLIVNGTSP